VGQTPSITELFQQRGRRGGKDLKKEEIPPLQNTTSRERKKENKEKFALPREGIRLPSEKERVKRFTNFRQGGGI